MHDSSTIGARDGNAERCWPRSDLRLTRSPTRFLTLAMVVVGLFVAGLTPRASAAGATNWRDWQAAPSVRLKVTLPISETVDRQLRAGIEQAIKQWETRPQDEPGQVQSRPTILLEFDTSNNLNGRGSNFESCLGLARYLQRPELRQVRILAYIPPPTGLSALAGRDRAAIAKSELSGHALLVALACEQIWLDSNASLVGLGPDSTDPELERSSYDLIAKRGVQWPPAVVAALVDPRGGLYRVNRADGKVVLVDRTGRESLNQEGQEVSSEELARPDTEPRWAAVDLAAWGLAPPPIINRDDLVARLETDRLVDFTLGQQFEKWSAALLRVEHLDDEFLGWATRSLNADRIAYGTNILFLRIDTLGGYDLRAAGQLALMIADLQEQGVRTVALLPNGAKGGETIVALACDEIVMAQERRFGGNVTLPLADESATADLLSLAQAVAERKGRDWSLVAALALGNIETYEYRQRQTGAVRILSEDHYRDLIDRDDWQRGVAVPLASGLTADEAKQRRVVDQVMDDVDTLPKSYSMDDYRTLQPTFSDRTVQRIARFVSRPGISHLLLMFGFFMLMIELSSPGLGIPGFVAACCLSLFFWGNYLAGSAGALEIILFMLGLAFVLIEVFVLPGVGLFGFGGGLMIMASLVLAGQKFIVPHSTGDWNTLAWNLTSVLGAMAGIFAATLFIHYYMESVPVLNRLVLKPPSVDPAGVVEAESRYGHLQGRHGIAISPLIPSGKVRFGTEVVSVVTDGAFVDSGREVRVFEVWDTIVKVEPVGAESSNDPPTSGSTEVGDRFDS